MATKSSATPKKIVRSYKTTGLRKPVLVNIVVEYPDKPEYLADSIEELLTDRYGDFGISGSAIGRYKLEVTPISDEAFEAHISAK